MLTMAAIVPSHRRCNVVVRRAELDGPAFSLPSHVHSSPVLRAGGPGSHMDRAALILPILIAEDNADIRDLLTDVLDDAGYRVVAAANGLAALDAARSCEPDIILVDAGMPRLDGAGFCRAYRDDDGAAAVVLISAATNDVIAAMTEACGAAASIPKPFEIEQVLETVDVVLARHAS